jgi:uncharacterized protein YjiS (DUF1127 family)
MHACTHESLERHDGLIAGAWGAVRRYFRDSEQRHEYRRAATAMLSLDDYLLRDIGVTRGDVERIARNGRF